jgi:hypothetical protein
MCGSIDVGGTRRLVELRLQDSAAAAEHRHSDFVVCGSRRPCVTSMQLQRARRGAAFGRCPGPDRIVASVDSSTMTRTLGLARAQLRHRLRRDEIDAGRSRGTTRARRSNALATRQSQVVRATALR